MVTFNIENNNYKNCMALFNIQTVLYILLAEWNHNDEISACQIPGLQKFMLVVVERAFSFAGSFMKGSGESSSMGDPSKLPSSLHLIRSARESLGICIGDPNAAEVLGSSIPKPWKFLSKENVVFSWDCATQWKTPQMCTKYSYSYHTKHAHRSAMCWMNKISLIR